MNEETNENLRAIKQSFRRMMSGPTSQSLRDKGAIYKLNWGVPMPQLKELAHEYGKDMDLAIQLWKEDIRECKIMATMIMPPDCMSRELAGIWIEQTTSQEMAEIAAFNLYQYMNEAPALAYEWIASDRPMSQIAGFQVLSRLFMRDIHPDERGINELMDQALIALQGEHLGVRHAAATCLTRLADLGDEYEILVRKATKPLHLDFFD